MILNGVMAVTLRYFTEFVKHVFPLPTHTVTAYRAVLARAILSVCPSVRHTLLLCPDE